MIEALASTMEAPGGEGGEMSKEELPQWAVERADDLCAQILERATNTDYGIGVSLDARDLIARALDKAAPGWRTDMENVPIGEWVLAWCPRTGRCLMRRLDDVTTHTASIDYDFGKHPEPMRWMPLPDAPEVE